MNKEELKQKLESKKFNDTTIEFLTNAINDVEELLPFLDWVKIGRYIESLTTDNNIQYGIKLATSNQNIYKKGVDY